MRRERIRSNLSERTVESRRDGAGRDSHTECVDVGQQLQRSKFLRPKRVYRDSCAPQNYENCFKGPSYTQKAPQKSETSPPTHTHRQRWDFILGQRKYEHRFPQTLLRKHTVSVRGAGASLLELFDFRVSASVHLVSD